MQQAGQCGYQTYASDKYMHVAVLFVVHLGNTDLYREVERAKCVRQFDTVRIKEAKDGK